MYLILIAITLIISVLLVFFYKFIRVKLGLAANIPNTLKLIEFLAVGITALCLLFLVATYYGQEKTIAYLPKLKLYLEQSPEWSEAINSMIKQKENVNAMANSIDKSLESISPLISYLFSAQELVYANKIDIVFLQNIVQDKNPSNALVLAVWEFAEKWFNHFFLIFVTVCIVIQILIVGIEYYLIKHKNWNENHDGFLSV